jgi:hypothetical protein
MTQRFWVTPSLASAFTRCWQGGVFGLSLRIAAGILLRLSIVRSKPFDNLGRDTGRDDVVAEAACDD